MTRPRLYCWVHSTTGVSQGGGTRRGARRCRAGSASGVRCQRPKRPPSGCQFAPGAFWGRPRPLGPSATPASRGKVLPARGWGAADAAAAPTASPPCKISPFCLVSKVWEAWGVSQPKMLGLSPKTKTCWQKPNLQFPSETRAAVLPVKVFVPQQRGAAGPSTLLRVGAAPGWEPSAPGCCWKSVSDADTEPRSFHGAKIQPQNQPGRGEFSFPGRVASSGELPPLVASWGCPKQAGGWGRQHRAGSIFNRGLARSLSPPSPQFAVQTTFSPRAKILAGKTPSSGETSHQGRPWPSAPGEPCGDKPPPKVGGRGRAFLGPLGGLESPQAVPDHVEGKRGLPG